MEKFLIQGGNELHGSLRVSTSKNATLPIIAASIMCPKTKIIDAPNYTDIRAMTDILERLGVQVEYQNSDIYIDTTNMHSSVLPSELTLRLRSSIFMLGPLLTRTKSAKVAYPGGCNIGNRPIDLHLKGLRALNVEITEQHGYIFCDGSNMSASVVELDFPSVGATENIMMAAVMLKGTTKIINSAKEPEIVDLQNFINSMGGKISGAGTSEIIIEGVDELKSVEYAPMSDRIICGTYLMAVAMTGGNVELCNSNSAHLSLLISKLKNMGCKISCNNDRIIITSNGKLNSFGFIETQPYPGFATDLQAQAMALSTIASGTSVITENLFETRFKQVPELIKMGANITTKDRTAIITGVENLYGADVICTDLRAGAALVIAGLVAKGNTIIHDITHIDRGYGDLAKELTTLGANIVRC